MINKTGKEIIVAGLLVEVLGCARQERKSIQVSRSEKTNSLVDVSFTK